MKILCRLPLLCLAALALAPAANAHTDSAAAGVRTVTGVRAFELSPAQGAAHEFSRTPSFAWSPVQGAKSYEFELSTSKSFSQNAIVWTKAGLTTPAVAVPLSLPWITGNPYSLYAHVRVSNSAGIGPWSKPFGFNMRWPSVAKPMQSYPGLLRWTPVVGATGYEVWLMDAGRIFSVSTNVADEREYYDFHQVLGWMGSVHWRIRAERHLYGSTANGLPSVSYGPWSPAYTSYNPPFQTGPLTPAATVSDVVTSGTHPSGTARPTHELMPAFVFTGNYGAHWTSELYRVYVFTDRDCLNVVYKGAIVGSPAYAPRSIGPLALPKDMKALQDARSSFLQFGDEGSTFTYDYIPVTTTESGAASTGADTGSGGDTGSGTGTGTGSGTGSGSGTGTGSDSDAAASSPAGVTVTGAKVDLWDSDWADGGYYWTVVPVVATQKVELATSLSVGTTDKGATLVVSNGEGISAGDTLIVGGDEIVTVVSVDTNVVTVTKPLTRVHAPGESVVRVGGGLEYSDAELTQDACASGRVKTFSKSSTPIVTSARAPYATGMSTNGRLVSATRQKPVFYGTPLVSWQPADSAVGYEVQWSKKKYPWKAAGNVFTFSTASLLPKLTPGTWYYRVRGYDPFLMGTTTQMSWSAAAALQVARPVFKLVG